MLLQEGQQINKIYVVERFLGEGGFAEVYRVRHRFMGRQAMKVFKKLVSSIEEIEYLLQEAITLSGFRHPNIISVYDANVFQAPDGLRGYFTMEYMAGGSLDHYWKSYGIQYVPIETTVDILRQTTRGLAVAHSETPPIIHRDIKPQNLLVRIEDNGLRVVVNDFGLAKRANPLTLMVSARGTRHFKAPETYEDFQSDSCAGDIWALGCTMYLLLTDRLPFSEPGEIDFIGKERFEQPLIPPSQLNLNVDPALDQMVLRCMAINPKDRYPSANELLRDLERWQPVSKDKKAFASDQLSNSAKDALGDLSSLDEKKAKDLAKQALQLAKHLDKLSEAADLMEEACLKWPALRDEYEYQIVLWRRGIIS